MLAVKITLAIALILSIVVPFGAYAIGENQEVIIRRASLLI